MSRLLELGALETASIEKRTSDEDGDRPRMSGRADNREPEEELIRDAALFLTRRLMAKLILAGAIAELLP